MDNDPGRRLIDAPKDGPSQEAKDQAIAFLEFLIGYVKTDNGVITSQAMRSMGDKIDRCDTLALLLGCGKAIDMIVDHLIAGHILAKMDPDHGKKLN